MQKKFQEDFLFSFHVIQTRNKSIPFVWNLRTLQFELYVTSQCRLLGGEYSAPAEEKNRRKLQNTGVCIVLMDSLVFSCMQIW